MALKQCGESDHEVSDKADKCQNCGDPQRYRYKQHEWGTLAASIEKCKECGHEVSSTADKCPNCGAPQKSKIFGVWPWIIVLLIGLFIASIFFNEDEGTPYQDQLKPATHVWNAKDANIEDVEHAREFLSKLPRGCGDSKATASSDGTVTIQIECSNASQSSSGVVEIKDGIVREIR